MNINTIMVEIQELMSPFFQLIKQELGTGSVITMKKQSQSVIKRKTENRIGWVFGVQLLFRLFITSYTWK